jgi:5-hydroxyisourate hydrolase-like protein (transthyretin family)
MKPGASDDPFADDSDDIPNDEPTSETATDSARATDQQLSYIHSRDGVKDGRTQRPIFLRDEYEDGLDDLVDRMEERFDQQVYKTDVQEAMVALGIRNSDQLASILNEWGYGWE